MTSRNTSYALPILAFALIVGCMGIAQADDREEAGFTPPFFANRVGVQFGTPEIEAAILKHLGYHGVSQDW